MRRKCRIGISLALSALLLAAAWSAAAAPASAPRGAAPEATLRAALQQNLLGLAADPGAAAARRDAEAFQAYRRSPDHGAGVRLRRDCQEDEDSNRFCLLLREPPEPRPAMDPGAARRARESFARAVRALADPARRAVGCPGAQPALRAIAQSGEPRSLQPGARYWLLQCALAAGESIEAERLKDELWRARPFGYHSTKALERDRRTAEALQEKELPIQFRSDENDAFNAVLSGVEALYERRDFDSVREAGQRLQRLLEVDSDLASVEMEARLYFASILYRAGREIPTLIASGPAIESILLKKPEWTSRATLEMLYPLDITMPWASPGRPLTRISVWEKIREASGRGDDPLIWMALAHQESAFNPQAASDRDAFGLMQLRVDRAMEPYSTLYPRAARAARLTPERLKQDSVLNIVLATQTVRDSAIAFDKLFEKASAFPAGGAWILALAGYHAGHAGVSRWAEQKIRGSIPPDLTALIDLIFVDSPEETTTSAYVASILAKRDWYARLYPQAVR